MKPYPLARRYERLALLVVAAVVSLSLISGAVQLLGYEEHEVKAHLEAGCGPGPGSDAAANATETGCTP